MMSESLLRDRDACIEFVERSPRAVAAKNKVGWIGLFGDGAEVEDPVGSTPHRHSLADGINGPVGRFYQTFIAPNEIRFEVDHDILCRDTVCRDLTIHITMTKRVRVSVPMHLRYELGETRHGLEIRRLAAHWELPSMIRQVMGFGVASLTAGTAMFARMLTNLGVAGVAGFARARKTVGDVGKSRVQQLAFALNRNDRNTLSSLVTADFRIGWGEGEAISLGAWRGGKERIELSKLIAAGHWVTATAQLTDESGQVRRGLLAAQFLAGTNLIQRCTLYV